MFWTNGLLCLSERNLWVVGGMVLLTTLALLGLLTLFRE